MEKESSVEEILRMAVLLRMEKESSVEEILRMAVLLRMEKESSVEEIWWMVMAQISKMVVWLQIGQMAPFMACGAMGAMDTTAMEEPG